ncbi:hypothetical protein [Streptomyces sp. OV198]|jgi:hypothetical protein|uniref:hypothetical protein n=1 Tax=Streptomyces sp. OV198 TaxID=1882787 RepID=UPI00117ECF1E|nr:hypothetical protein [Streptomyces sp. OV198]
MEQHVGYRDQVIMQAAVLPARAVYLIREGSADGFRRAIQEASTRWGGVTEPIICVPENGEIYPGYRQTVELSRVVGAVNVDLPNEQAHDVAQQLGLECVPLSQVDAEGTTRFTCHPSHVLRGDPTAAHVLAREEGDLWEVTAAGDLTAEAYADMQRSSVPVRRPRSSDEIGRAQVGVGDTLLQQTAVQFGEYRATGLPAETSAVIWVTQPNDLNDCLSFWNLRALRSLTFGHAPMVLLPANEVEHWIDFDRQTARIFARPAEFAPDAVLVSGSVEPDGLHALARLLGLQHTDESRVGRTFPPPALRQAPFTYQINLNVRQFVIFDREYGLTAPVDIHVFDTGSAVRFPSPVAFYGPGGTLLHFFGQPFDGLPRRRCVAPPVHENATWHGDSIQLKTRAEETYQFQLLIPSLAQACHQVLADVTERYELSDKGRMGAALQETNDLSHLLEPGVFEAMVGLMTPRSKSLAKELRALVNRGAIDQDFAELAGRWGSRTERRYLPAQQLDRVPKELRVTAAEKLSSWGWAERGLKVSCPRCGLDNFVPLERVSPAASCPGCSAPASYSVDQATLSVFYRLDTLIDRATDQGVLPHLMVIAALTGEEPLSSFLPGANLWFPGTQGHVEVDVFGICGGKVMTGEIKTSASEFTEDQMRRDVRLSARLGADVHLLAAVDTVPQATQDFARALCETASIELRVLDSERLRPSEQ